MYQDKMNVSIIIPTLGRCVLLNELLENLKQLVTPPLEVIVVDQTHQMTEGRSLYALSNRDHSIKHIPVDFVGPCKSRNYGAELAKGDLLWFLDDDMVLNDAPDPITYISEHYAAFPNSVLMPLVEGTTQSDLKLSGRFFPHLHLTSRFVNSVDELRFSLAIGSGSVIIPKRLFCMLGGFDERFDPNGAYEDRDLGIRCYYAGINVFQSNQFTIKHLAASTGGRRHDEISRMQQQNTYRFWGKYLSEDLYYIQIFSYWLSRKSKSKLQQMLMAILKQFIKQFLKAPNYHDVR